MEIRRLRYFIAVADELHFGRAAARLHMAQPPLSEQIRKLEEELGAKLFERTSRSVALTAAGLIFLAGARRAMEEIDRASHAAQQAERGLAGHLVIGCFSSASVTFLPAMLRLLLAGIENLQPELRLYGSDAVQDALLSRTLDIGFVRPPIASAELASHVILRDPVVVALPADHALARLERVHIAALSDAPFILFPPHQRSAVNRLVERVLNAADINPRAAQFGADIFIMLGLVGAGLGVALLPGSMARLHVDGVAFRHLDGVDECFETALVWRADDKRALVHQSVRLLRDALSAGSLTLAGCVGVDSFSA